MLLRLLAVLAIVALASSPAGGAEPVAPSQEQGRQDASEEEGDAIFIGLGAGWESLLHLDLSWWVVDGLTMDLEVGLPIPQFLARVGPTLHVGPASSSAPAGRAHRAPISYLVGARAGIARALWGQCLDSDPPQCSPPEREWLVGAELGIVKRFSAVDLRLSLGLDYWWGKLPSPRESRFWHEGPWRPQFSVTWLWR